MEAYKILLKGEVGSAEEQPTRNKAITDASRNPDDV